MRALVTGGAGFIGSHIADALIANGHEVAVVDNLTGGRRTQVNPNARFYLEDIGEPGFWRILAREHPEVVFHQAAQMSVKKSTDDPVYDARVNVMGLLNVLEACTSAGVRKVVFASSGATYGNPDYLPLDERHPLRPVSPYGISKMVAEHYLSYYALDRGLQFTALRYGNVYGPRQDSHGEAGVIAIFTKQLLSGRTPVIHWDGEQVRDYVYVEDVARANFASAKSGDGGIYCIGTGVGTSVNRVYSALCDAIGTRVIPEHAPRRAGDLRAAYFDTRLAQAELHWTPRISLEEGLRRSVSAFRAELAHEREVVTA